MATIASIAVHIGADNSGFIRTMNDTQQRLERNAHTIQQYGQTLTLAVIVPLKLAGIAALKMAGDLEQTRVAFHTLVGDVQKADKNLRDLGDHQ